MQQVYAWTQCIGIDASIPGTIMRTLNYYQQRDWTRAGLYTLLSVLLLFTACIVSSIESIQQTLNITLNSAYSHVFVPIEALIWVRSIAVVLLVVVHAVRHVGEDKNTESTRSVEPSPNGCSVQLSVQNQTILVEKPQPDQISVQKVQVEQKTLPAPMQQKLKAEENRERVNAYMAERPEAKAQELVAALSLSLPTVRKYMKKIASS